MTSDSRSWASPHISEKKVKPIIDVNSMLRQPKRPASHPTSGVAIAVATILKVTTHAIWSCVADIVPLICGSTTLASVWVMPNMSVVICTMPSTSHCRGVIDAMPVGAL